MTDPLARLTAALASRYRIERAIGAGGMATVYLARDLKHNRKVALKVLKPELASVVGADRFLREIEVTANLQHPHILPLFESGEADGFLFYVMPFVDGESLRACLGREGRLSIAEATRVMREVADALAYAHSRGVVHRDIKPDNVMVSGRHATRLLGGWPSGRAGSQMRGESDAASRTTLAAGRRQTLTLPDRSRRNMQRSRRVVTTLTSALLASLALSCGPRTPSAQARRAAEYAVSTYLDSAVATLADLVAFRTVREEGIENAVHPEFRAMSDYLRRKARELGLDLVDHGAVVVIGLGVAGERLGLITHGDVQPADPSKWASDPFRLDTVSEPGRLVGRGAEDDKGPIAAALYAMKALRDQEAPLARRVELVISYTEESDWGPFQEFLRQWTAPAINVALDAEYPVVTAEKGWGAVYLSLPPDAGLNPSGPTLLSFRGGRFISQIPEEAEAVLIRPTPELGESLRTLAARDTAVRFEFRRAGDSLVIGARGVAAHSSKPEEGRNAIAHLAALLGVHQWPGTQAGNMVRLVNDLVGTSDYGERFDQLAYSHDFMGPLTLSVTTLERQDDGRLAAAINIRWPVGRSAEELRGAIRDAITAWRERTRIELSFSMVLSQPYLLENAPHVPVLLDIFRHYARQRARPVAIGGGTHARLVPNGVNFGPAMPGEPYTGHSEHEYLTREQFGLNLRMYTAMLVELAVAQPAR